MSRPPASTEYEIEILRDALMRIRLHGSPWWIPRWESPEKIANEALRLADNVSMRRHDRKEKR